MSKQSVSVEVEKEVADLIGALSKLVVSTKAALADGFQPGTDLPAFVVAAMADLPPALAALPKLGEDMKEDRAAFARAVALGVVDLVSAVMGA